MKFLNATLGAAALAAMTSLASPVLAQDFVLDGEAAALYMTRSDKDTMRNQLYTTGGATIFDNDSVALSWEPGAEARLGISDGMFGVEVGGFFIGEYSESAVFTGTTPITVQTTPPTGYGTLIAGDSFTLTYESRIRGMHAAFTYKPAPVVTLYVGPRYINLTESLQDNFTIGGVTAQNLTWHTRNRMFGGTAGVRADMFDVLGVDVFGLSLDTDVGVSLLRNKIQSNYRGIGSTNNAAGTSDTDISVGFDLGLDLGYEVANGVKVFAGYNLMYIRDVAKAVDQVRSTGGLLVLTPTMSVRTDDVLYHGFRAGIKVCLGCREQAEPAPAPVAEPAPAPAPAPEPARNYLVFFDWDSTVLTQQSLDIISEAASAAKAEGNVKIDVTGHADKSGSDDYNLGLSRRRAEVVIAELERQGVPASEIAAFAKGESDPLVPTADGVREPQNRRVQIVLN